MPIMTDTQFSPEAGSMTGRPKDLMDFEGRWDLDRRIEDRLSRRKGHFRGEAHFNRSGSDLFYFETGELRLDDGLALSARREYLWCDDGSAVRVTFADGRPFHGFPLSVPVAEVSHWCDPDLYEVRYEFVNWPNWTATWSVQGPRKHYVSVTCFTPTVPKVDSDR